MVTVRAALKIRLSDIFQVLIAFWPLKYYSWVTQLLIKGTRGLFL